ncbi:hypothetical protein GGR54DRAFT_65571 [Hypoxylon sp. NC1633]|nr:hypothetical protein GGR54DRAFT_65571 [Hypoxylon sp. NC1633]
MGYYLEDGTPGSADGNCLSVVSSGATITFASTSEDVSTSWSTATTVLTESSYVGAIAVVGWNIEIATSTTSVASQRPTTSSSSSSSSFTSSLSSPSSSTIESSARVSTSAGSDMVLTSQLLPSPTSTPQGSSGTSVSTAVGVGVGVGVGVILLGILSFLIYRRRSKRKREAPVAFDQHLPPPQNQNAWAAELYSDSVKPELEGNRPPVELP